MNSKEKVAEILLKYNGEHNNDLIKLALSTVDLTTLNGSDTDEDVVALCDKGKTYNQRNYNAPNVAAICIYPTLVKTAKMSLVGTDINVASVAGAFPSGLSPINIKVDEVKYAVEQGADEIDMVISRGKFLEGKFGVVADEIMAIKRACGDAHLKVILETGELVTDENIKKASDIAIEAGADFIKTSTGKIAVGATLEAFYVMCTAIKEHYDRSGKMVGIKPAGGISTIDDAMMYLMILESVLGERWMNKKYFRIGASRLADRLFEAIR